MSSRPDPADHPQPPAGGLTRRQILAAGGAGLGGLALGGVLSACGTKQAASTAGGTFDYTLRAQRTTVQLGSRTAATWTYDGRLPGPEIRLTQGRPVRVRVINELDVPTSVHWHGIRLQNKADGVPGFTQAAIKPGGDFVYQFTPPDAGTYMLHSHSGMQLDRGLYAPVIVQPVRQALSYDVDATLMFDDWLDGLAGTPDKRLAQLRASGMQMGAGGMSSMSTGTGMSGMTTATPTGQMGMARHTSLSGKAPTAASLARMANLLEAGKLDPGDVPDYPLYLVNGRPPADPHTILARTGDRVRLRLINPSADTMYCVFVERHPLDVIAADGQPVTAVRTDALVLAMGERYDVLLSARGGTPARIIAVPLGKKGRAVAVLRFRGSNRAAPAAGAAFTMPRRVLSYEDLRTIAAPDPKLTSPVRTIRLDLAMGDGPYTWTIGGQAFPKADTINITRGEHVRFVMNNTTKMPHPMHLHGHSFHVGGITGPLKDTALSVPGRQLTLDWVAENPGTWAYHCHNAYHQEAGMMRRIQVT